MTELAPLAAEAIALIVRLMVLGLILGLLASVLHMSRP